MRLCVWGAGHGHLCKMRLKNHSGLNADDTSLSGHCSLFYHFFFLYKNLENLFSNLHLSVNGAQHLGKKRRRKEGQVVQRVVESLQRKRGKEVWGSFNS